MRKLEIKALRERVQGFLQLSKATKKKKSLTLKVYANKEKARIFAESLGRPFESRGNMPRIIEVQGNPTCSLFLENIENQGEVFSHSAEFWAVLLSEMRLWGLSEIFFDVEDEVRDKDLQTVLLTLGLSRYEGWRLNYNLEAILWLKISGKRVSLAFKEVISLVESINLARHLVNMPSNILTPLAYVDLVKAWFKDVSDVEIQVWLGEEVKKAKFHLLYAVGQASYHPPALIHLKYRPEGLSEKTPIVCLVGKGVTFDSGGLDIKPSSGMRLMKKDMGGAASAFAVFNDLVSRQVKQKIDLIVPLAENSLGGRSFRPGDVLESLSGKTVEIHNTDAEGRLLLADALTLAMQSNPGLVIDFATLTGAARVALGTQVGALFSNSESLANRLVSLSQKISDPLWRLPLVESYSYQLKSSVADLVNCGDGFGGAITAALFLREFVDTGVPWIHLDIYAWREKAKAPYLHPGGSGQGVLAVSNFLRELEGDKDFFQI